MQRTETADMQLLLKRTKEDFTINIETGQVFSCAA